MKNLSLLFFSLLVLGCGPEGMLDPIPAAPDQEVNPSPDLGKIEDPDPPMPWMDPYDPCPRMVKKMWADPINAFPYDAASTPLEIHFSLVRFALISLSALQCKLERDVEGKVILKMGMFTVIGYEFPPMNVLALLSPIAPGGELPVFFKGYWDRDAQEKAHEGCVDIRLQADDPLDGQCQNEMIVRLFIKRW